MACNNTTLVCAGANRKRNVSLQKRSCCCVEWCYEHCYWWCWPGSIRFALLMCRTTSPRQMDWSTRFGPLTVLFQGYVCKDAICLHCVPVFHLQLQTRLYAALVHGEFANAYLFSGNMPSGTNAVVKVIHRSFVTLWCLTNRLPFVNTHCCFATALQNSSCIHWEEW